MKLPSQTENPDGLHRRYNVTKADGTPADPNAVYFVLRLDSHGDDPQHILACRAAARAYIRETTWGDADTSHLEKIGIELKALLNKLESETVQS